MEGVESAGGSEEPGQGRSSVNTNGTNVAVTNVGLPSILPTNNSNNNASAFMSWREHRDRDPLAALGAGEAAVGVGGFFDPHSPQSNSDDSEMEDAESLSSGHRRMSMSTSITSAGGYSGALALQNTQTMGGSGGTMPMMLSSRSSDARRLNRPQPYPISGADSLGGSPYRGNGIVLGSPGRWVPPPVTVHPGQWNRMHVVPLTSASNSNSISAGSTNNGFDTPGRNRSHSFSGGDVSMDVARRERSGSSSNSSGAAAPPLLPLIGPGGSGPSLSGSGSVSAGFAGTGGHGAPSIVPPHTPAHNRSKSMSLPSAPTGLHDHPALGSGSLGGGSGGVGATPLAKKNRISALLHEDTPEHEIEHERGVTWLLKRQLGMLGVSPAGGEELPLPPHTPVRRASEGGMLPSISAIAAATSRREFVPLAPPTSDPSLDSHDDAASDRLNSVPPSDTFTSHEEDETASMLSVSMSQEPLTPRSETRGEELNLASGSRSIPRRRESFMVDVEGEELLDVPVYSSGQAYAVRMSPIPNSQLKMPLNYVSKTSKLNPENSVGYFFSRESRVSVCDSVESRSSPLCFVARSTTAKRPSFRFLYRPTTKPRSHLRCSPTRTSPASWNPPLANANAPPRKSRTRVPA